jgi:hypothetical protein
MSDLTVSSALVAVAVAVGLMALAVQVDTAEAVAVAQPLPDRRKAVLGLLVVEAVKEEPPEMEVLEEVSHLYPSGDTQGLLEAPQVLRRTYLVGEAAVAF